MLEHVLKAERMMSVEYMARNDVRDIHVQNVRLGLKEPSTHLSWNEYALVLRNSRREKSLRRMLFIISIISLVCNERVDSTGL